MRTDDLRPTVLLVEDSPFWAALVQDALCTLSDAPPLLVVEDATGAIAAFGGDTVIGCVLLDICLPGPMTGLDILEYLRGYPERKWVRDLPVAIYSTSPSGMDRARAKISGVDRYISKAMGLDGVERIADQVREFVATALEKRP